MENLAASLPILLVIVLMVFFRWNGAKAGLAGWLVSMVAGYFVFKLDIHGLFVSQLKGLYLSGYVLAIIWPALALFHLVSQISGVKAVENWFSASIKDQGLLQIGLAWAFSGMIEGLAGFGLPVAIISPILVGLRVPAVMAVAATAVGHSWSVTFGDMGVIFQTLITITGFDAKDLIFPTSVLLGISCLACGWGAMLILKQSHLWLQVSLLGLVMAVTQYGFAQIGLIPLSAFLAGLVGMVCIWLISRAKGSQAQVSTPLKATLFSYGGLTLLLLLFTVIPFINQPLRNLQVTFRFPEVVSGSGYMTAAVSQPVSVFLHPGMMLTLVFLLSFLFYARNRMLPGSNIGSVLKKTYQSAVPTSIGILSMVGLASVMDYSGMMQTLAQTVSQTAGTLYPLISPLIGILGAFATGSNNNSNVIFAQLQLNSARYLELNPAIILAAQTTGGALGSMLAPAKIIVGCSTVGLIDGQGKVLRITLGIGIGIGLLIGLISFLWA